MYKSFSSLIIVVYLISYNGEVYIQRFEPADKAVRRFRIQDEMIDFLQVRHFAKGDLPDFAVISQHNGLLGNSDHFALRGCLQHIRGGNPVVQIKSIRPEKRFIHPYHLK
ncbi:hypothetical protein D3C80_1470360 [compost metagenome]